ncbi:MAG: hypothetical protein JKY55_09775 [Aliivibrio sp.]|uniref:hypothetical protein n=1 Tax=Aliivibrio sp. TaxID=1872443 RepID=UPI001A3ECA57|nr:hypothetical protein [Aliivibrio sp.]
MSDIDDLINEAVSVSTSSRHEDLNKKVVEFCQKASDENYWLEKVFSGLAYRNFHDFLKLKKLIAKNEDDDLPVIAYYSRNLLEVGIWTAFCFQSAENAHIFYSDVGRDGDDLLKKNLEMGIDKESTITARAELKQNAAKQNVHDIEQRFTSVHKAAKEVGLEKLFLCANKQLSKFAHPTALQIISPRSGQEAQDLAKSFYTQASVQFCQSIYILEIRYGLREQES